MKIFSNIKLIFLLCLTLCIGGLTSCNDDDDNDIINNGQVSLLSFGPTGAKHGDTISFIGYNLDKVDAIELPNATVTKDQFVSQTSDLIEIIIPTTATAGNVVLKVSGSEDVVSKTVLSFEVPVTITTVTSQAKPGTNITITGNYLNWVEGVVFGTDPDTVTAFVSQTMTELVVTVPMDAKTGALTFFTGGTEPLAIETENELMVTLPIMLGFAPNPVELGTNLTISGTDLDLVQGVMFKGVTDPVSEFVSKSADQLVVTVPTEAGKGTITLVTYSGVEIESETIMQIAGDLPELAALPYVLFDDARGSGWGNYSWGGAIVWNSTERVRQGTYAAKKTYDGSYDAIRLHSDTGVSTSNYTELTFSVYGDAGTDGKTMNIVINEAYSAPYTFKIVEGEWTTYNMKLSDLGKPASITDIMFQSAGWAGVVHYDHIGLK